jgi:putative phosphoesterase
MADESFRTMTSRGGIMIGVISDTHGLLRSEVLKIFEHAEYILHAGNIGGRKVLDDLQKIAPVRAVRGSADHNAWGLSLPETNSLEIDEVSIYLLHDVNELNIKRRYDVIISGHGHVAKKDMMDGVLYFNPGCAGPQQGHLPVSVGRLTISGEKISHEIVELAV